MTLGQIYLLGALCMGLRTLWATRPEKDPATGELANSTLLVFDDGQEHDIRYLVTALFAMAWPVLIVVWLYLKLVVGVGDAGDAGDAGDEDDLPAE